MTPRLLSLRLLTNLARPFMILARASLNIPGGMSRLGNPLLADYQRYTGKAAEGETVLVCLETTLQCILGLQNDILGLFPLRAQLLLNTAIINKTPGTRLGKRQCRGFEPQLRSNLDSPGERLDGLYRYIQAFTHHRY